MRDWFPWIRSGVAMRKPNIGVYSCRCDALFATENLVSEDSNGLWSNLDKNDNRSWKGTIFEQYGRDLSSKGSRVRFAIFLTLGNYARISINEGIFPR